MATNQNDFVTESKQRGGKRDNAGRKSKHGEPTAIIRLPVSVIEKIKQRAFDNVTNSSIAKLQAENDLLYAKAVTCFQCTNWTNDKCSQSLKPVGFTCDSFESWQAEIDRLKSEIEKLNIEKSVLDSKLFNSEKAEEHWRDVANSQRKKVESLDDLLLANQELKKQLDDLIDKSTLAKKNSELRKENKELAKQNDKLYQQVLNAESKLKDSERDKLNLKTELEKTNKKYQDLINLPVPEFAEFQKNHFVQFGKQADLKGN